MATQYRSPGIDQPALVNAVQAGNFPVLVGEQLRPVEYRLGDLPAEIGGVLEFVTQVRGVGKQLLGDAADVDAGAAEAA